jgi:phosphatidylinositol alpha-1,6-mannosyltransferase
VPQVAGDSGGAAEAVVHGETGFVVDRPGDPGAVAAAIEALLVDDARRAAMGAAGRERAVREFTYDALAVRLGDALAEWEAGRRG